MTFGYTAFQGTQLHKVAHIDKAKRQSYIDRTLHADKYTKACLEASDSFAYWACGGFTPFAVTFDKIEEHDKPLQLTGPCKICFPQGLREII